MLQQVFDDFDAELWDWQHEGWENRECAASIIKRHKAQDIISPEIVLLAVRQATMRGHPLTSECLR